jgi:hypothetical protein
VTPAPLIDEVVVTGNVFDEHHSRNRVVRHFMAGFDQGLHELLDRAGTRLGIENVRLPMPWTQVLGRPRLAARL